MKLSVLNDEQNNPWYAKGLKFTCTQCGNCCTGGPGFVWISKEEIVRLGEFLKISPEEVVEQYCRKVAGRWSLKESRNSRDGAYDCIFLREDGAKRGCSIYPVRPLQCRTWPFWESNLKSPESWKLASRNCHGMDRGRLFSQPEMESLRDAEDWPRNPPTSAPKSEKTPR
ncbi:MAG: YkgJ family cysteine cluster protein [Planctomycetota bacterium]|nr:YkgJ family cysteine cluster protein [Planctomycetota bacterium]